MDLNEEMMHKWEQSKKLPLSAWIETKNQEAALYAPIHQPFYKRLWALLNRDI